MNKQEQIKKILDEYRESIESFRLHNRCRLLVCDGNMKALTDHQSNLDRHAMHARDLAIYKAGKLGITKEELFKPHSTG